MSGLTTKLQARGQVVTDANPLPVNIVSNPGVDAYTDGSGTIATLNVSQQVFAANADREYFIFINHSDTDMWLNFGVAAVVGQPSIPIPANGGFFAPRIVSGEAINVICSAAGKAFTAKQV